MNGMSFRCTARLLQASHRAIEAVPCQHQLSLSCSRRDSKWANSALVVAVGPSDWEPWTPSLGPLAGMAMQMEAERYASHVT